MSTLNAIQAYIEDDPSTFAADIAEELDGSVVSDEIVDQSRWSTYSEVVVNFGGHFVLFVEEHGSTENQVVAQTITEFYPVEPYEVTVTKYRKIA